MATKSERIEARLSTEQRDRIERAATVSGLTMSRFIVEAAVERADEVIAVEDTTVVPARYFDALVAALDDAPDPSPRLAAAARRAHRHPRIAAP